MIILDGNILSYITDSNFGELNKMSNDKPLPKKLQEKIINWLGPNPSQE